jgi:hypothetical protein
MKTHARHYHKYEREHAVNAIYDDMIAGLSRYEIRKKLQLGEYEKIPDSPEWGISKITKVLKEAFCKSQLFLESNRDEQRILAADRYDDIYTKAMIKSDFQNALRAQESKCKLLGLNDVEKLKLEDSTITIKMI